MTLPDQSLFSTSLDSLRASFIARIAELIFPCGAATTAWVELIPLGKPTMTNRSKWLPKNQAYLSAYCGGLLAAFNRTTKFEAADAIQVISVFTGPSRFWGSAYTKKPDSSNILKGVEDALVAQDQHIFYAESLKFYGPESGLLITLINARA